MTKTKYKVCGLWRRWEGQRQVVCKPAKNKIDAVNLKKKFIESGFEKISINKKLKKGYRYA